MKTKVLSIILLGASLGLGSCSDYLDMTPTDRASDKLVWSKLDYAEQAVNDFYRYIDYLGVYRDGQCLAGMTEALTDQLKYGSYNYMAKCQIPSEIAYGGSVLTVNYVSTYLGNWGTMYEYVRRVNEGINKLKKYASFGQTDEERLEAEMRFFRGYLYTDLLKRYKEVIIYDENLDNIKKDMPVSSEADGWNFVYNDLKYAGEHLPVDKTPNGRLTSGAAYAMLSRAMLYAERWDDARIAAEKVMGMGYELEAKNYYCRFGEIDIIAREGKYLCFVEVKYRKNEKYGAPEGAISPTKIKRICKTSQFYLWEHKLPEDTPVRYDVVFIIGDECRLVRDAFSFFG